MQYIIEAIPVFLAVYAAIACGRRYTLDRRSHTKQVLALGVASSLLLIIAQSSWYVSFTISHSSVGTWFADRIWLLFNSITMLAFIILAHGGKTNVEKPTSARD